MPQVLDFQKEHVRRHNDAFRRDMFNVEKGHLVLSQSIQSLEKIDIMRVCNAVAEFDAFSDANNPWGENDFASMDVVLSEGTERIFFKIDYYDRTMQHHTPNKLNNDVTIRALFIDFLSNY